MDADAAHLVVAAKLAVVFIFIAAGVRDNIPTAPGFLSRPVAIWEKDNEVLGDYGGLLADKRINYRNWWLAGKISMLARG